ncbi:MAG TPA: sulfotransferase [Phycisphaerae bacterium]|nr:sulfotransferase [Phycisphaerae bacterium]HOB74530.1 sulfotransferase [Phycisphaerae bacterium]HOJ54200.1 sulfotransferase [Phycisphaerae bacterium]HOL26609.1 sulfotransferase [Phycisphaerae bacterium]HPP20343.1 sulfotransferase [Phycisphaerae bacterium]
MTTSVPKRRNGVLSALYALGKGGTQLARTGEATARPSGESGNVAGARKLFVYIASPSFSGSTLLTFLLNAHPDVCTVGELKAGMPEGGNYLCSCGRRLVECDFWQRIVEEHARLGRRFDLNDFGMRFERQPSRWVGKVLGAGVRCSSLELLRDAAIATLPPLRRARDRTLENIETFALAATRITGARVFLDGSKDPFRLKYLPRLKHFKLKVIRIIRDGRGVTNSMMRNEKQSLEASARSVRNMCIQLERMELKLPAEDCTKVYYERLCREPNATLNALYRFLDLDPSRAATDYRGVEHHIMGNRMRLRNGSEITLDEKWRRELSAQDLEVFERIAGDMNRAAGYE